MEKNIIISPIPGGGGIGNADWIIKNGAEKIWWTCGQPFHKTSLQLISLPEDVSALVFDGNVESTKSDYYNQLQAIGAKTCIFFIHIA